MSIIAYIVIDQETLSNILYLHFRIFIKHSRESFMEKNYVHFGQVNAYSNDSYITLAGRVDNLTIRAFLRVSWPSRITRNR